VPAFFLSRACRLMSCISPGRRRISRWDRVGGCRGPGVMMRAIGALQYFLGETATCRDVPARAAAETSLSDRLPEHALSRSAGRKRWGEKSSDRLAVWRRSSPLAPASVFGVVLFALGAPGRWQRRGGEVERGRIAHFTSTSILGPARAAERLLIACRMLTCSAADRRQRGVSSLRGYLVGRDAAGLDDPPAQPRARRRSDLLRPTDDGGGAGTTHRFGRRRPGRNAHTVAVASGGRAGFRGSMERRQARARAGRRGKELKGVWAWRDLRVSG